MAYSMHYSVSATKNTAIALKIALAKARKIQRSE